MASVFINCDWDIVFASSFHTTNATPSVFSFEILIALMCVWSKHVGISENVKTSALIQRADEFLLFIDASYSSASFIYIIMEADRPVSVEFSLTRQYELRTLIVVNEWIDWCTYCGSTYVRSNAPTKAYSIFMSTLTALTRRYLR